MTDEKMPCKPEEWYDFPAFRYCSRHNQKFSYDRFCIGFPIVPLRSISSAKSTLAITERQAKALKLEAQGKKVSEIGKELGVSRQAARSLLQKGKRNAATIGLPIQEKEDTKIKRLTIRLHNDEFLVKIEGTYSKLPGKIINKGRNLEYKLVKNAAQHIKIHKNNTMTVRFLEDIEAESEFVARQMADLRCELYLELFNIKGAKIITGVEVVNRHYGILGSTIAKKVRDERKIIIIKDDLDKKIRLRMDFSHKKPEIDTEHVKYSYDDSSKWTAFINDVTKKDTELLSTTKQRIDKQELHMGVVLGILQQHAENIKLHLGVMQDIRDAIREQGLPKTRKKRVRK